MSSLLIVLCLCLPVATGPPVVDQIALADRQQFAQSDWPYLFYLDTTGVEPEDRLDLEVAVCLMVASSSRQPIIEACTPQIVGDGVLRIDLRALLWNYDDWRKLLESYPYRRPDNPRYPPITIRADWLLSVLSDTQENDAYYRLVFGVVPKTRDEALQILNVGLESGPRSDFKNYGMVEEESRVAKNIVRWIENRPIDRGYAWGTRDMLKLTIEQDPSEHLTGDFKHDGEEWIIGIPKYSISQRKRGALQVYFLANGQGGVVTRAPVDLVEDATRFKGLAEIRNPGSCIQCHNKGPNEISVNGLERLVASGVDVYATPYQGQLEIEAFHLSDLKSEIERNQEDFGIAVELVTGLTAEESVARFQRAVNRYVEPVTVERAAIELGRDPEVCKKALSVANGRNAKLGARLSGLVHGLTVPREAWEDRYREVQHYMREWEN